MKWMLTPFFGIHFYRSKNDRISIAQWNHEYLINLVCHSFASTIYVLLLQCKALQIINFFFISHLIKRRLFCEQAHTRRIRKQERDSDQTINFFEMYASTACKMKLLSSMLFTECWRRKWAFYPISSNHRSAA